MINCNLNQAMCFLDHPKQLHLLTFFEKNSPLFCVRVVIFSFLVALLPNPYLNSFVPPDIVGNLCIIDELKNFSFFSPNLPEDVVSFAYEKIVMGKNDKCHLLQRKKYQYFLQDKNIWLKIYFVY